MPDSSEPPLVITEVQKLLKGIFGARMHQLERHQARSMVPVTRPDEHYGGRACRYLAKESYR